MLINKIHDRMRVVFMKATSRVEFSVMLARTRNPAQKFVSEPLSLRVASMMKGWMPGEVERRVNR